MSSTLGLAAIPVTDAGTIADKTVAASATRATLVEEFDIWRESYAGATVEILKANSTERATVYSDANLSSAAANPQTLLSREDSDARTYGKFQLSLYVAEAYHLKVTGIQTTGVQRAPITTLKGEDAKEATSTALGGSRARTLRQHFADVIQVLDYGNLLPASNVDASSTENTATVQAAIGIASGNGGGVVYLPAGRYAISTIQIPTNVMLAGQAEDGTILQSDEADKVVTITGDDAGLRDLSLDGLDLTASSFGVYGKNVDRVRLENVTVKRFDKNIEFKGGEDHRYRNLTVKNGNYGFRGLGDSDVSNGNDGDEFDRLLWIGGEVSEHTTEGIEISVVDLQARFNQIQGVLIKDNIGAEALLIYGAENTELRDCKFTGNLVDLNVRDNPDTTLANREVKNLYVEAGRMEGTIKFDGLCDNVVFDRTEFSGATFEFNTPTNQIVFRDVMETSTTTSGDSTKKSQWITANRGTIVGTTSSEVAATVWKHQLEPGEVAQIIARAVAQQTNGEKALTQTAAQGARCDSADLDYDGQTANFTVGATLTGQTSGATATILADVDGGTTGTLSLANVVGTFVDNETITDGSGGSATVNGSITFNNAALLATTTGIDLFNRNSGSPAYALGFAVSGREVQVTVTGASNENVSWAVDVELTTVGG
jgi:hypothetical protein